MDIRLYKTGRLGIYRNLDLLIIPVSGGRLPKKIPLDKQLAIEAQRHIETGDLKSSAGSFILFYPEDSKPAKRVVLLELGKGPFTALGLTDSFRRLKKIISRIPQAGIVVPPGKETDIIAGQFIISAFEASFRLDDYKTAGEQEEAGPRSIVLFCDGQLRPVIGKAKAIGESLVLAKRLSNQPANILTPKKLSGTARQLAAEHGLRIEVLGEERMKALKMGGILAVSQGSHEEAQLIILEHNPKAKKVIGLVGKGVTFDSGGISIKTTKNMDEMKYDMSGGAAVLAVMVAAVKLKLPYRLVGVVASSENLPDGRALKPGDVLKTLSGKTVEVVNTDAEGRLILADALTYLQKNFKPQAIIDIATLTGSVAIALGNKLTGAFGNSQKLNSRLLKAAEQAGEEFWFLPLHPKSRDDIKSRVADLANIGKGRNDALLAPAFLESFIENSTPWLHIDIAGTAWNREGATGVAVATLINLLASRTA